MGEVLMKDVQEMNKCIEATIPGMQHEIETMQGRLDEMRRTLVHMHEALRTLIQVELDRGRRRRESMTAREAVVEERSLRA
jgi:hypothetical protein